MNRSRKDLSVLSILNGNMTLNFFIKRLNLGAKKKHLLEILSNKSYICTQHSIAFKVISFCSTLLNSLTSMSNNYIRNIPTIHTLNHSKCEALHEPFSNIKIKSNFFLTLALTNSRSIWLYLYVLQRYIIYHRLLRYWGN